MRWTEYVATLRPEVREHVLNMFTAGCGNAALAARMLAANAAAAEVLGAVAAAQSCLLATNRALARGGLGQTPPPDPPPAPRGRWRELAAALPPHTAAGLQAALLRAVQQARLAVGAAIANAEVDAIREHLDAALDALEHIGRMMRDRYCGTRDA